MTQASRRTFSLRMSLGNHLWDRYLQSTAQPYPSDLKDVMCTNRQKLPLQFALYPDSCFDLIMARVFLYLRLVKAEKVAVRHFLVL